MPGRGKQQMKNEQQVEMSLEDFLMEVVTWQNVIVVPDKRVKIKNSKQCW